MKQLLFTLGMAGMVAASASAGTINYTTAGSTLSCNGIATCVQNNTTSVTVGGLTFTYSAGSGNNVNTPSIINLGNIASSGAGSNVNVTGLLLTLKVSAGALTGNIQSAGVTGSVSTNSSGATIAWTNNNTTTGFGTLPGVVLAPLVFQVLNPSLGLQAPTVGTPVGQTSIQGTVTDTSTPEPATMAMLGLGLGLIGLLGRRTAR